MFDLRLPKGRRFNSVNKSNTAVTLPGITKTIAYLDSDHKKNRSTYLDTISHLSSNVEYEQKDTFYVNKEQHTLKTILKKMNRDTMELIDSMKPKKSPRVVSKEHLNLTAEKEVENNKKIAGILKYEIDKLKDKYTRIVQHQEEQEVLKSIVTTKEEIQKLKQLNIEQKVSVSKDGNEIVRELSQGNEQKLVIIDTDHQLVHNRLEKLKADVHRVREQSRKLLVKIQDSDPVILQLQTEVGKIKGKNAEEMDLKKRELLYNEKKLQLESIKKKIDFYNNFGQVKYFKALKELETQTSVCSVIETKTIQIEERNKFIRQEVGKLQMEFAELRRRKKEKGRAAQDYLENQRKSRVLVEDSRIQDFTVTSEEIKQEVLRTDSEISKKRQPSEVKGKVKKIKIQDGDKSLEEDIQISSPSRLKEQEMFLGKETVGRENS